MVVTEYNKKIMRKMAAEGAVLLKNDNNVLPIGGSDVVSVFGRVQTCYYKSGTGSGGMVNTEYKVGIMEGLRNAGITLNEELAQIYDKWVEKNPFDIGGEGWAKEPWFQKEMPVSDDILKSASEKGTIALVVIGRTAGEDKDNAPEKGSYYLTDYELKMMLSVRKHFKRMAVVLNVGNIIDMKWIDDIKPDSVLYAWHGGMEGGNGVADVISGRVSPCGKLSDTIAYDISDYPSHENFGNKEKNIYKEDIYVGYRYFETFAQEKVMYPFGFGMSYTRFDISASGFKADGTKMEFNVTVKNIGGCVGKEVVQVYLSCPCGTLDKPEKVLVAFDKTKTLSPGESEILHIGFDIKDFASYDENISSYILDSGTYSIYVGNSIRDISLVSQCELEYQIIEELSQALAPTEEFDRIKNDDGKIAYEKVRTRQYDLSERIKKSIKEPLKITGDKGYKLTDVKNGNVTMEEFVSQLSVDDLCDIVKGEGMNSPKVRPGTGAAFGGITRQLAGFGIPAACVSDGPSGIRLDNGDTAMSIPIGTLIACSWNVSLTQELFEMVGLELTQKDIEGLLGPGMNIHRHPLNGRNFEYFSEDPYLSGVMGTAQTIGIAKSGATSTLKHFIGNNQETYRTETNSVISERAIREIYLKGFEIAVKKGNAKAVMTTYGALNGIWTAGSYDLCTTVLRNEWGFDGFVMTDWWAKTNDEGEKPSTGNLKAMIRAQNDIFMTCNDTKTHENNIKESLENGSLSLWELQRCAMNILRYIVRSKAMDRENMAFKHKKGLTAANVCDILPGAEYTFDISEDDIYDFNLSYSSGHSPIAQTQIKVFIDGKSAFVYMVSGTFNSVQSQLQVLKLCPGTHKITFEYDDEFVTIKTLCIKY